jgi:hypothetical protein
VEALRVVAITVTVLGVLRGLSPQPLNAVASLVIGSLLLVLPAHRSLRRWDEFHSAQ